MRAVTCCAAPPLARLLARCAHEVTGRAGEVSGAQRCDARRLAGVLGWLHIGDQLRARKAVAVVPRSQELQPPVGRGREHLGLAVSIEVGLRVAETGSGWGGMQRRTGRLRARACRGLPAASERVRARWLTTTGRGVGFSETSSQSWCSKGWYLGHTQQGSSADGAGAAAGAHRRSASQRAHQAFLKAKGPSLCSEI